MSTIIGLESHQVGKITSNEINKELFARLSRQQQTKEVRAVARTNGSQLKPPFLQNPSKRLLALQQLINGT